jgi:hypothetical protein
VSENKVQYTIRDIEEADALMGAPSENLLWLRETLGNTPLIDTAKKVVAQLAKARIPHLIVGGLAVQEHGYPRTTVDVDIVVPDVDAAVDWLSSQGFQEIPGPGGFRFSEITVVMRDRQNHVKVDILPGGGKVDPKAAVSLPVPQEVSDSLRYIDVAGLIVQKIGAYINNSLQRAQDKADVVELIKRTQLGRDLLIQAPPELKAEYLHIWDDLHGKKP